MGCVYCMECFYNMECLYCMVYIAWSIYDMMWAYATYTYCFLIANNVADADWFSELNILLHLKLILTDQRNLLRGSAFLSDPN